MWTKPSNSVVSIVIVASILGLCSCKPKNSAPQTAALSLTVAKTMSPINVLLDVADAQDLWRKQGISVREQVFPSARQAMDAIVTNSSDMATVADTPLLIAEHRQQNLKLFATIAASDYHIVLILKSNKVLPTCAGLRNKRIALALGTSQQYFLYNFLHVEPSACGITVVNLTPIDAVTTFVKGDELDAIVAWEPQISTALTKTGATLVPSAPFPEAFGLAYGPKSKLVDAAIRARVRTVLSEASNWAELHPTEIQTLLAKSQHISMDTAEALRQRYDFAVDREDQMIAEMAQQEQWAMDKGYIHDMFGVDKLRQMLEK